MIQRKAKKWEVDDNSQIEAEKQAYKDGFFAGKKYIKDNVKLTVTNDAISATYQTLRQYRENLIKWVDKL